MRHRQFASVSIAILAGLFLTVTPNLKGFAVNKVLRPVEANKPQKNLIAQPQFVDLTGRWKCDDGGIYYIRQVGNELFWFGESPDKKGWTNVYHGFISGDSIVGSWADVPKGNFRQAGEMDISIESPRRLVATRKTGGFGGGVWTR